MPGKRPYRLGKRQASVDSTRQRIVHAAIEEYAANGIPDTSMQAVARRAEVAPGTVLYHYPDPDALVEAVVEVWLQEMKAPSPEAIDPQAPLEDRVGELVRELFGLYERSAVPYRIYSRSPEHPVLKRYEEWWSRNANEMMFRALGDHAGDPEMMKVVSVLVDPGFRGTLLMAGVSSDRAAEIATQLAISWLSA